jgi:hypothetical protein
MPELQQLSDEEAVRCWKHSDRWEGKR